MGDCLSTPSGVEAGGRDNDGVGIEDRRLGELGPKEEEGRRKEGRKE